MGKNEETPRIVIDEVEYTQDQLSEEQITLINHVADLDRKMGQTKFNLDQMQFGRNAIMAQLQASLAASKEEPTEEAAA